MVNSYDIAILSEKVARLEALLAGGGVALPEVTSEDNGRALQVVNGAWAKGLELPELPSVTASNEGEALVVNNEGKWSAGNVNAADVEYSTGVSVKDMIDIKTGVISANPDVTLSIARRQLIKVGNLLFVSIAFAPSVDIAANTDILVLSSGFESSTLIDLVGVDDNNGSKPFTVSNNSIKTNKALTSGVYYFINSIYY